MDEKRDHILYIDDEQENLVGFKYVFKKKYKVHIAISADEGWQILKNNSIKVIITDQRMPKTTGVQFLEKAAVDFPEICRIILTGYTDVQDIILAINKGKIFQFIRKPWDKEEVKIILDNAIKLFDLQRQNRELVESLKETNIALEDANKTLEHKVEQRTKEIEAKNKELEKHRNNLEELVKQRTGELEIAKDKAEESDRLKTSFLANVSHEIRTPMNAIIGFSELLVYDTHTQDELQEFKEQIVINSKSLLRLIDDILDISSIEANQLKISYNNHNLHQALEELSIFFNEQKKHLNKPDLEILLELPSENDLYFSTDKVRLIQILSNLIGNALKFTDAGIVRFGYKLVETSEKEKFLQFHVIDSGIGIVPEAQKYIFERFRKIEGNNNKIFRGTGLGLFISKSLVERLNGKIWIESEPDKGAAFYFNIPYIPADSGFNEKVGFYNEPVKLFYNFEGKSIVIAEDEDSSYLFIEKVLRNTNANLIRAKNGKETVEIVKSTKNIDLILMDLQMPVMNGYQAISIIKEQNRDIPIIVQTAYALIEQREKILSSGCNAFIPKPFKSKELLEIIKQFI